MSLFLAQNLAPFMFVAMVLFLLSGFPVAFALSACGLVFGLLGMELGLLTPTLFQVLPDRIWSVMGNETLLAIPFFTLMGLILERSGMAEDLLETIGQLFGPIRGGLAYAVILVGAMLAATTGVVAASVISMGLISLPIMLRSGYDKRLASGVIAASGTLAQIIPPSLVLIVLADQLGRSVGDLYRAAFVPGLVLTGLYGVYVFFVSVVRPEWAPAMPAQARGERAGPSSLLLLALAVGIAIAVAHSPLCQGRAMDATVVMAIAAGGLSAFALALTDRLLGLGWLSPLAVRVCFVLVPPLALIFLVLGTIYLGVATPTEGGAMGAAGALLLAGVRRRLSAALLRQAVERSARLTTFVLFILIGARVFSLTFYGIDGHKWVESLLSSLPGGQIGFLVVVNLLVFVLAFFLDFFELAFIVVPLLAPAASALGIDLVWFGVLLAVNMQTSFMHPPFGFALFYLRSVAPVSVSMRDIYWGALPFVCIQLLMVGLVIAFPQLASTTAARPGAASAGALEFGQDALQLRERSPGSLPAQGDPNGALERAILEAERIEELGSRR